MNSATDKNLDAESGTEPSSPSSSPTHEELEAAAIELRRKLLATLNQLDERIKPRSERSRATMDREPAREAQTNERAGNLTHTTPRALIVTGTGILFAVGGGLTLALLGRNRKKSLSYRLKKGVQRALHRH